MPQLGLQKLLFGDVLKVFDDHIPASDGDSPGALDDRHKFAVFRLHRGLAVVDALLAQVEDGAVVRPLGADDAAGLTDDLLPRVAGHVAEHIVDLLDDVVVVDREAPAGEVGEQRMPFLLRHLLFGDILQGLHGADQVPPCVPQGCRGKVQPLPLLAPFGEEVGCLVGLIHQLGLAELAAIPGRYGRGLLPDQQVCQGRPLFIVKGLPGQIRTDHLVGPDVAELFQCPVPVDDLLLPVDHEGRDRRSLNRG